MSYVVLARKYRPRTFAQMVGQEHVVRALGNALQQQRLHHAYLFTGTRGIGKTTVSRILAKSLNCTGADGQGGITATPCGVCRACTEIDADRYLDYIEMDAASNGGKDEIRDLIERAAYKPGIGRFKVFMIDEAHQLSKDAFNALLKTLEEPPDYLKFVLATTDPEKILPTVLSRCLQFNLRPMASEVLHGHLQQVLGAEGVASDPAALRLLSRAARGSMRDALSLTDQAIAYGGGVIDEAGVRAMLGAVDSSHAAALVEALARRDAVALLARLDLLRTHGLSADGSLESMAVLLQDMAVEQAVPGTWRADDPSQEDTRRLAGMMPADETQLLYSIVLQGRGELQLMSDDYSALTMVLLRMLAFAPAPRTPQADAMAAVVPLSVPDRDTPTLAAAAPAKAVPSSTVVPAQPIAHARPASHPGTVAEVMRSDVPPGAPPMMRPPVAQSPEPPPWLDEVPPPEEDTAAAGGSAALRAPAPPAIAVAATAPSAGASLVPTPLGARWADLVDRLMQQSKVTALTRELAWQAGLVQIDAATQPPTWRLCVERDSLRADALRDKLCQAVVTELGEAVQIVLDNAVPTDSPARRDAAQRELRQRQAESSIRSDPLVIDLMAQFKGARIVPGSIKPI